MPTINGTAGDEDLVGTSGDDLIYGLAGKDRLYAQDGNDLLDGGDGNDHLDGGTGADTMQGGAGSDVYKVDNAGDVVSEETGGPDDGAVDYVQSTVSFTLGAFVERLELMGSGAINGTGNELDNTIKGNSADNVLSGLDGSDILTGNDGNDTLIGGAGKDYLTGGAGADTFVFGAPDAAGFDRIYDFTAEDRLGIHAADFGLREGAGLIGGQLDPAYFVTGSAATAGHGQFVYNPSSASLYWDPDGTGSAARIAVATFSAGATVTAAQFTILSADPPGGDNAAPTVTAPPADAGTAEDAAYSYDASAHFADPDGDALTYSLSGPDWLTIDAATGVITGTPENADVGTHAITVTAADAAGASVSTTYQLTVTNVNDAPVVATEIADHSTAEAVAYSYDASQHFADADLLHGDTLTYSASGLPDWLAIDPATGLITGTPQDGDSGTYTITVSATDAAGANVSASYALTVTDPNPTSGTVTVNTGILDTMLQQASPTAAAGSTTTIGVDSGSNSEVQTLLSFASLFGTGPGQIPQGAIITSATLTLQTTNGSNQGGSLHRMLVGWDESSTWDSMGNGVQINGTEAVATADVTTGSMTTGSRAFDVTQSVQAWASGAANHGWVFQAGGTDGWDFSSSEGSVTPVLTVTYTTDGTAPPPPMPIAAIQNATATEGPDAKVTFTVTLDQAAGPDGVVVSYETQTGTAGASDFTGVANGSITFAQGEISKTIEIALTDDTLEEGTETFGVRLTSATNATVSSTGGAAIGSILDDEGTPPPPPLQPTVVKVTDTTAAAFKNVDETGYGIGDPSGLAYVPGLQKLFIADSEHDESPYFSSTNLFSIAADGTVEGYDLSSFSIEPTGLAYNPKNGMLYLTDDDARKVFWVDPANPTAKLGEFSTVPYGEDSEDPQFDPITGNMFMLDGEGRKLYELTAQGALVSSINLPSVLTDAEALAYDSTYDVFFIGNGSSSKIWQMDRSGNILNTIDIFDAYRNPATGSTIIKGLELAPSSDPNDGNTMNLYVADYGSDQSNDGRILEVNLGSGWMVA